MKEQTIVSLSRLARLLTALTLVFCVGSWRVGAQAPDGKEAGAPAAQPARPADANPFDGMIRSFQENYRLGPADEIAVRIKGQPEYSLEKTKITPTGTIYHQLLGDVQVAGMTLDQAREHLTKEFREYLKDPIVSLSLIEAVSAKFAVLGDVMHSGVYVMSRPINVVDAIAMAGGFALTGSQSNVEVIRPSADGTMQSKRINVQLILKGKAKPEENLPLQQGDIVVVHGNLTKAMGKISAIAGFGSLASFMTLGRR